MDFKSFFKIISAGFSRLGPVFSRGFAVIHIIHRPYCYYGYIYFSYNMEDETLCIFW